MICDKCGSEINEWLKIPELKIEVEVNLHTEMNKISLIKIPKGCRLLELSEWLVLLNKYKDKIDWGEDEYADEVVAQPKKDIADTYPYWNVWLLGGLSVLGNDYDVSEVRGVRFCRDLERKK